MIIKSINITYLNRNEIDRKETKRIIQNEIKPILTKTISWGKTTQKLNVHVDDFNYGR
jgi:hypothetical protein